LGDTINDIMMNTDKRMIEVMRYLFNKKYFSLLL